MPQQKIDCQRTDAKQEKRARDAGNVPKLRPVKAERHETQSADNDKDVRGVKAEHARQPERVADKRRLRKHECHERSERRDEKREAEQRAPLREDSDRDEEHIDVAKLHRQLTEPVETVESGHLQKLYVPGQKALVDEKADDVRRAQCDEHGTAAALRLAAQQHPQQHDRSGGKRKEQQMGSVKRSYDHGETSSWKTDTSSANTRPRQACSRQ